MIITPVRTKIFKEEQDLTHFITDHVKKLREKSVLVVSSKIVALSRGLTLDYRSPRQKENLIKAESTAWLKTPLAYLTIKNGMIMTNAGVDESNAGGKLVLLPQDCYQAAEELRQSLRKQYHLKQLGIIITDSMILPLRAGVIGAAVGYSGFKGVRDERGQKDIFGRKLGITLVNLADALAAAASMLMGEGAERRPLCVIEDAPVAFVNKTNPEEIKYPVENDLYTPLLKKVGLLKVQLLKGEGND